LNSLNISWRPSLVTNNALNHDIVRFGNSAGNFNTVSQQYIQMSTNNAFTIGSNDFTVEFFVNLSNIGATNVLLDTTNSSTDQYLGTTGLKILCNNSNLSVTSNTLLPLISTTATLTANVWNYFVLNGVAGNLYAYLNGDLVGNVQIDYNFTDTNLTLGASITGSGVSSGVMDELRITTNASRYTAGVINIPTPYQPFPRTITEDVLLTPFYTPILWGFENFTNESNTAITFNSINSQSFISDLSWNQKKLQLVNYGANLIIDSTTINTIETPQTSSILEVLLNQE